MQNNHRFICKCSESHIYSWHFYAKRKINPIFAALLYKLSSIIINRDIKSYYLGVTNHWYVKLS